MLFVGSVDGMAAVNAVVGSIVIVVIAGTVVGMVVTTIVFLPLDCVLYVVIVADAVVVNVELVVCFVVFTVFKFVSTANDLDGGVLVVIVDVETVIGVLVPVEEVVVGKTVDAFFSRIIDITVVFEGVIFGKADVGVFIVKEDVVFGGKLIVDMGIACLLVFVNGVDVVAALVVGVVVVGRVCAVFDGVVTVCMVEVDVIVVTIDVAVDDKLVVGKCVV